MPIIRIHTEINANIDRVFDLARSVDLHKISAAQTNEEAIAGRTSGLIELDDTVTWRAKHFGIYQTLTVKITALDRPTRFVDEMVSGAFHSFTHEHLFESISPDRTSMTDVFNYESPLGVLGRLADVLFLKRYMHRFLEERNLVIKDFAESNQWKRVLL